MHAFFFRDGGGGSSRRAWVAATIAVGIDVAIAGACTVVEGDVLSTVDAGSPGDGATVEAAPDADATNDGGPDADASAGDAPDACATADFTSDPHHCGRCGHDCLGGGCVSGVCQPALIAAIDTPGGLAVDADHVYWTTTAGNGSIYAAAKDGSNRRVLATGQVLPLRLVIDDAYVYWGNGASGGLFRVSKAGGNDQLVASTSGAIIDIAVDATGAYFVDLYGRAIRRAPRDTFDGGLPPAIASNLDYAWGMAMTDDAVYFTTRGTFIAADGGGGGFTAHDGHVFTAPKEIDATVRELAGNQEDPVAIAHDTTAAYWLAAQGGAVMRLGPGDTAPVAIATGQAALSGLALDDTYVYFTCGCDTGGLGRVERVPKVGGPVDVLAGSMKYPSAIAVDDLAVYWNNIDGASVMRVAK